MLFTSFYSKRGTLIVPLLALLLSSNALHAQPISERLVGTNLWYMDPSETVWNLTGECGIQTIRIGGHAYDDNMPSKTKLLEWIKKIRSIGAEPMIQVSQYQSAEAAAELVRYFNVELSGEIDQVKYWNIGNEPWLQNNKPAISTVGAMVEAYFKPRAEAMKEIDSTIYIYGPDFCYYIDQAINDLFGGKNDIAGKIPGKSYYYCDGISWHLYPQDDNINLAYQGLDIFKSSIIKCKAKVDQVNAQHQRNGNDALVWGIGEFNAKDGTFVHTWENGQMFGGILGLCMKYEAEYATTWSMFENGGSRQGTDFSMIDGANMTPRASYRHMELVANYFEGAYCDGSSSTSDFIVYGARNEDQVAVMIMHRASNYPKTYTLHLNDTASSGEGSILNLNAGLPDTWIDHIDVRTTQVLVFRGDSILRINYTSDDFDNERSPSYTVLVESDTLPKGPGNLEASALSYNSILLSWNDLSDNEFGFILERKDNNDFATVALLSADDTSYSDVDLNPETTYTYRISAYNNVGKSTGSNEAGATTEPLPLPEAYNGPHIIPGIIEAEDFNLHGEGFGYHDSDDVNEGGQYRSTGVDIEHCSDIGGGYNVGYIESGEWLAYKIEDVTPGVYAIAIRTAANTDGTKRIDVYLGETRAGTVYATNTNGWQNWETHTIRDIEIISEESLLMELRFFGKEFNINWIEFIPDTADITGNANPSLAFDLSDRISIYQDISREQLVIRTTHECRNSSVTIYNSLGQIRKKLSPEDLSGMSLSTSNWNPGIYFIEVRADGEYCVKKFIVCN